MQSRFLLSTASLYLHSLPQTFYLAREAGFDGLELSLSPAVIRLAPSCIQTLAQTHDLLLASVHPPTVPLPGWGYKPEDYRRLAGLARALSDCRLVVLHVPDAPEEQDPAMQRFLQTLQVLQQALAGSCIRVALENRNRRQEDPLRPLDPPEPLLAFCQRHDCSIVLDTAHASTLPFPLLETYRVVRERLINVHLSDVKPGGWWTRFSYPRSVFSHHRPPGEGILPLPDLLAQMGQDGYQQWITLELSPVTLPIYNRHRTIERLQQSLQTCQRWISAAK